MDTSDDPVIASYDVFLTDSEISRYVLQYIDRAWDLPYDERHERKPAAFRLKPKTGNIEVDIPINTRSNYDQTKGLRYGNAMLRSRVSGGFGMAGGFSSGPSGSGSRVKAEADDAMDLDGGRNGKMAPSQDVLRVQTLGGRVKIPEEGDPVYMLAAFRGRMFYDFIYIFSLPNLVCFLVLMGANLQKIYTSPLSPLSFSYILNFTISMLWTEFPPKEDEGPRRRRLMRTGRLKLRLVRSMSKSKELKKRRQLWMETFVY